MSGMASIASPRPFTPLVNCMFEHTSSIKHPLLGKNALATRTSNPLPRNGLHRRRKSSNHPTRQQLRRTWASSASTNARVVLQCVCILPRRGFQAHPSAILLPSRKASRGEGVANHGSPSLDWQGVRYLDARTDLADKMEGKAAKIHCSRGENHCTYTR